MTAIGIILSFAILAVCALCRPNRATCPIGYDLRTGIQRDGYFACWPHPVGDPEWDGTFGRPDRSVQPGGVVVGRLYCTGGARPIAGDDGRAVGCQR